MKVCSMLFMSRCGSNECLMIKFINPAGAKNYIAFCHFSWCTSLRQTQAWHRQGLCFQGLDSQGETIQQFRRRCEIHHIHLLADLRCRRPPHPVQSSYAISFIQMSYVHPIVFTCVSRQSLNCPAIQAEAKQEYLAIKNKARESIFVDPMHPIQDLEGR